MSKHRDTLIKGTLIKIFLAALAVRWIYAFAVFLFMGNGGLGGVDSETYIVNAQKLAAGILAGTVHGGQWFGSDPTTMPLFAWLIGAHALIFPGAFPISYVLTQGALDAGTCVLVFLIARTVNERYALPAAAAAVLNPTQIVLAGLVYTDTPFVFFTTLFFFGAVGWLREPGWRPMMIAGIGLGAASLVRTLLAPWVVVAMAFFLIDLAIRRRLSVQRVAQVAAMAAIGCLCVGAVILHNAVAYGAWSLTSQGGRHLAIWIVPLAKEADDGTPWTKTVAEIEAREAARFGPAADNPFEEGRRWAEIGKEALGEIRPIAFVKSWLVGAAINLASPAIILSPPILQLPRTGFYSTPGASPLDKMMNFMFHSDNAYYAWALLLGLSGVVLARAIQILGMREWIAGKDNSAIFILIGLWVGYILAVNGPVASPKYRLPLEPLLMVLTGAGVAAVQDRWRAGKVAA